MLAEALVNASGIITGLIVLVASLILSTGGGLLVSRGLFQASNAVLRTTLQDYKEAALLTAVQKKDLEDKYKAMTEKYDEANTALARMAVDRITMMDRIKWLEDELTRVTGVRPPTIKLVGGQQP